MKDETDFGETSLNGETSMSLASSALAELDDFEINIIEDYDTGSDKNNYVYVSLTIRYNARFDAVIYKINCLYIQALGLKVRCTQISIFFRIICFIKRSTRKPFSVHYVLGCSKTELERAKISTLFTQYLFNEI